MIEIAAIVAIGALVLLITLVVIDSSGAKSFTSYPDHVSTAAFLFVGVNSPRPSYLGGGVDQVAAIEARISRKRAEAAGIQDVELRECVHAWLDYYERKIPEWRKELQEQTSRKDLEAYKLESAAKSAKVDELLRKNGLNRDRL